MIKSFGKLERMKFSEELFARISWIMAMEIISKKDLIKRFLKPFLNLLFMEEVVSSDI